MREIERTRRPAQPELLKTAAPQMQADVTEPTIVRDADTREPVFVYARYEGDVAALRSAVLAYPPSTTYRMAGTRNISRTFGYSTRRAPLRRSSCRPCSGATDSPSAHATIVAAADTLADQLERMLPERASADRKRAEAFRPEWIMGGWWTSGVVNFNSPLPYHYDANNWPCWSAMPVLRRGVRGGYLHVPEYELAVKCRDGDVCFFAGYDLMHATTPLIGTDRGYRISAVYYTVAGMRFCDEPDAELERGRRVQTEREDNMRERQGRAGLLT